MCDGRSTTLYHSEGVVRNPLFKASEELLLAQVEGPQHPLHLVETGPSSFGDGFGSYVRILELQRADFRLKQLVEVRFRATSGRGSGRRRRVSLRFVFTRKRHHYFRIDRFSVSLMKQEHLLKLGSLALSTVFNKLKTSEVFGISKVQQHICT